MNTWRNWFWEIEALGQGPDSYLSILVNPTQGDRLVEVVQRHMAKGFVRCTEFFAERKPEGCSIYEVYMDDHSHSRMVENRMQNQGDNIWYYGCIEVRDNACCIEHVLAPYSYDDTELVVAIAKAPELAVQQWNLGYKGYSVGEVASGLDATSLLTYLNL